MNDLVFYFYISGKMTPPVVASLNSSFGSKPKNEEVTTAFVPAGRFSLDRFSEGPIAIYLDDNEYPLDGSINLTSKTSPLPQELLTEVRGFWVCMLYIIAFRIFISFRNYTQMIKRLNGIVLNCAMD